MKKSHLTIGIPAFNESANIGYLLSDLFKQKFKSIQLKNIIVVSDGSTDQTVKVVQSVKLPKNISLKLVSHKIRKGRAERQNEIMKTADSELLVLIDADILITDPYFLEKICQPILKGVDLTSVKVVEIMEETWFTRVLAESMAFKRSLFEKKNQGNNLYTCHGRARAFSKRLYKKIHFSQSVGEDAYSYLYTKAAGFKYQFVKNTQIVYKLPSTFQDHEKQSIRFYKTQRMFNDEFGTDFVKKENFLTTSFILTNFLKGMFHNPTLFIYVVIATYLKVKSFLKQDLANQWGVSETSKQIRGVV